MRNAEQTVIGVQNLLLDQPRQKEFRITQQKLAIRVIEGLVEVMVGVFNYRVCALSYRIEGE